MGTDYGRSRVYEETDGRSTEPINTKNLTTTMVLRSGEMGSPVKDSGTPNKIGGYTLSSGVLYDLSLKFTLFKTHTSFSRRERFSL